MLFSQINLANRSIFTNTQNQIWIIRNQSQFLKANQSKNRLLQSFPFALTLTRELWQVYTRGGVPPFTLCTRI